VATRSGAGLDGGPRRRATVAVAGHPRREVVVGHRRGGHVHDVGAGERLGDARLAGAGAPEHERERGHPRPSSTAACVALATRCAPPGARPPEGVGRPLGRAGDADGVAGRARCPGTPRSSSACDFASVARDDGVEQRRVGEAAGTCTTRLMVPGSRPDQAPSTSAAHVGRVTPTVAEHVTPPSSARPRGSMPAAVRSPDAGARAPGARGQLGHVGVEVDAVVVERHLGVERSHERSARPPPTGAVDATRAGAGTPHEHGRRRAGRAWVVSSRRSPPSSRVPSAP
jgi:hypothetical protein